MRKSSHVVADSRRHNPDGSALDARLFQDDEHQNDQDEQRDRYAKLSSATRRSARHSGCGTDVASRDDADRGGGTDRRRTEGRFRRGRQEGVECIIQRDALVMLALYIE